MKIKEKSVLILGNKRKAKKKIEEQDSEKGNDREYRLKDQKKIKKKKKKLLGREFGRHTQVLKQDVRYIERKVHR